MLEFELLSGGGGPLLLRPLPPLRPPEGPAMSLPSLLELLPITRRKIHHKPTRNLPTFSIPRYIVPKVRRMFR